MEIEETKSINHIINCITVLLSYQILLGKRQFGFILKEFMTLSFGHNKKVLQPKERNEGIQIELHHRNNRFDAEWMISQENEQRNPYS